MRGAEAIPTDDDLAAQGLRDIHRALTRHGVAHAIEQVGGGILALVIEHPEGLDRLAVITDEGGVYVVGRYTHREWDEGDATDYAEWDTLTETVNDILRGI